MSTTTLPGRAAPLYDRVKTLIPPIEWPVFADDIEAILHLKRQRDAVILAHNYMTPEIFHCVADIVGDSLALAREAMKVRTNDPSTMRATWRNTGTESGFSSGSIGSSVSALV